MIKGNFHILIWIYSTFLNYSIISQEKIILYLSNLSMIYE